jgi:hypothetical protein
LKKDGQAFVVVSPLVNQILVRGLITLLLQAWVVVLMWKKKLVGRFPVFFSYVVYQMVEGIFRWIIEGSRGTGSWLYYYVYWATEILEIVLLFCALGESVWHVFRSLRKLRWFWRAVTGCLALTLAYAVWSGWQEPPKGVGRQMSIIIQVDLIATYVPIGVGLLFFIVIFRYNIGQYPREAAIIAGLAMTSGAGIITMGLRSYFGPKSFIMTAWIAPWGYILAELIWIREFLRSEPPKELLDMAVVRPAMEKANEALGRYQDTLKDIDRQK